MQNENSIDIRRFAENERFARERAESTADSFNDAKVSSQAEVFFETEAEIELSTQSTKRKLPFFPLFSFLSSISLHSFHQAFYSYSEGSAPKSFNISLAFCFDSSETSFFKIPLYVPICLSIGLTFLSAYSETQLRARVELTCDDEPSQHEILQASDHSSFPHDLLLLLQHDYPRVLDLDRDRASE